jgi:metallophosphoesterase (TIGR00282 family)
MLKILFLGDITGKLGREIIKRQLPQIKKNHRIDYIIANSENSAHGNGVTPKVLQELQTAGIDYFTGGDHSFDERSQMEKCYGGSFPILRPANYSDNAPGKGYAVIEIKKHKILLINLIGRVFMKMDYDCPFTKVNYILANFAKQKLSAIIIDIHAEATSEKISLKHYLDGRVSAILGTHTHIMTADSDISKQGTAYLTDVGMCGLSDGCIGINKESVIETFLTQIKSTKIIPEKGNAQINGVILGIDEKTGKTKTIKTIIKKAKI